MANPTVKGVRVSERCFKAERSEGESGEHE